MIPEFQFFNSFIDYLSESLNLNRENDIEDYIDIIEDYIESKKKLIIPKDKLNHIIETIKKNCNPNKYISDFDLHLYLKDYCMFLKKHYYANQNRTYENDAFIVINEKIVHLIIEIEEFLNNYFNEAMIFNLSEFDNYLDNLDILEKEEFEKLEQILKFYPCVVPQGYIDLYIKNVILCHKTWDKDLLNNLLQSFAINYAKKFDSDVILELKHIHMSLKGSYVNNNIEVTDEYLKKNYNNIKQYYDMFHTFFHELRHLYQDKKNKSIYFDDYLDIMMVKDDLLASSLSRGYYTVNYFDLLFESEASLYGRTDTEAYLSYLYIPFEKENLKGKKKVSLKRYHNGQYINLDILFDNEFKMVMNFYKKSCKTDVFEVYPILNYMFFKDGRRKTTLDLLKLKKELSNKLESELNKEEINKIEKEINNINLILENKVLSYENLRNDFLALSHNDDVELEYEVNFYKEKLKYKISNYSKLYNEGYLKDLLRVLYSNAKRYINNLKELKQEEKNMILK